MNLLIVDDEYYIVKGIDSLINREKLGIDAVFTAYSVQQAKRILEKEKIDILLTDIEMPHENGLDLIEWILSKNYPIVPLILTGHQRFDYAHKALGLHCFGYILKPVDKRTLEKELGKAIESLSDRAVSTAPSTPVTDPVLSSSQADNFVEKIQKYISANLNSDDLTRNSVAECMHMNPDYLSNLFHAKFGQTMSSYITNMRIDKAKELLTHTDLSLNEICEQAGFSSCSYFHKQFKKITGSTPQQFRNR